MAAGFLQADRSTTISIRKDVSTKEQAEVCSTTVEQEYQIDSMVHHPWSVPNSAKDLGGY